MTILSIITILFTFFYILFIVYLIYQWNRINPSEQYTYSTEPLVTIVISARNEEDHILDCINSCLNQKYPAHLLEIIVVDDQSEDATYEIVESIKDPRLVLMRLGVHRRTTIKGSKKKALAYGVNHAKGEIICTTDADCIVPENWIKNLVVYFSNQNTKFVCGPIKIIRKSGFINRFQTLDFSGSGLVNAASMHSKLFYLGNAANLAYRKEVFLEGDAFENNYSIASGDDVFLLDKVRRTYPNGIVFAKSKDVIVETHAMLGWTAFIHQRMRWAGKMSIVKDWKLKAVPIFVWMQRVFVFGLLIASISLKDMKLILISISCLILQWLVDFILQMDACRFYNIKKWEVWFIPIAFVHSVYFIILGLLSWMPISPKWKGRRI